MLRAAESQAQSSSRLREEYAQRQLAAVDAARASLVQMSRDQWWELRQASASLAGHSNLRTAEFGAFGQPNSDEALRMENARRELDERVADEAKRAELQRVDEAKWQREQQQRTLEFQEREAMARLAHEHAHDDTRARELQREKEAWEHEHKA